MEELINERMAIILEIKILSEDPRPQAQNRLKLARMRLDEFDMLNPSIKDSMQDWG